MTQAGYLADWRTKVVFGADGPQPRVLHEDTRSKVVVVGLEPGAQIPPHAGGFGVYHFVEGAGEMFVDAETFAVQSGATVVVPDGAVRGMRAATRLAFVAVRVL